MSTRRPRLEVVRRDGGYIARIVAANGKVALSSGSQLYVKRSAALRALTIAVEAVQRSTLPDDGKGPRVAYRDVDEREATRDCTPRDEA